MRNSESAEEEPTLAELAQTLNAAHPRGAEFPSLVFFTDENRLADPLACLQALPSNCAVIFRHYSAPDRAQLAAQVVAQCREQARLCLMAGDEALARDVGADGLHLPEHMVFDFTPDRALEGWLVTAAAHDEDALVRAAAAGAHAAFLSPVFDTESHLDAHPLGLERFAALAEKSPLPVYALGGITEKTAPQLLDHGAVGLGAIGALITP